MIREMTSADIGPYHRIRVQVIPYLVMTLAGFREQFDAMPARAQVRDLVAEVDGEVVGGVMANLNIYTSREGLGQLNVLVAPAYRRRGIGAALLAESLEHLRHIGAREVRTQCMDLPESRHFAERRGFVKGNGTRYSGVKLSELPPQPPNPEGVRLVSAAEAGPAMVYELDMVTSRDIPSDISFDNFPKDEWRQRLWDGADSRPDLGVVALVGDVPAAATTVMANPAGRRGWTSFTGVLPQYRGMGLAKLVKSECLHRSAAIGITEAFTNNHSVNAPMLAVNTWLGYRPVADAWSYSKQL